MAGTTSASALQADTGGSGELVGRSRDLDAMMAVLGAAGRGPRLATVEGPTGTGRTAMLNAIAERAEAAGFRVLQATADPREGDAEFGVAQQLFEPLVRRAAGPVPGVAGRAADHALYLLAADLSLDGPVLLTVDDLQWVDPRSVSWLCYLTRRIARLPVAVVLAHASGARTEEPVAVAELLAAARHRCVLGGLDRPAVARLATATLGADVSAAFVERCHAETGGNPLLLTELLRLVRHRCPSPGVAPPTVAGELGAENLGHLLLARLRETDPVAHRLLGAVAILGRTDLGLAAVAAEADPVHATDATHRLDQAGLLAVDATSSALVLTVPAGFLLRSLRQALSHAAGRPAHRRAALALAERRAASGDVDAHLASAAEADAGPWAGPAPGPPGAALLGSTDRAARAFALSLDPTDPARACDVALAVLDDLDDRLDLSAPHLAGELVCAGSALLHGERHLLLAERAERLVAAARRGSLPLLAGWAYAVLAQARAALGQHAEAVTSARACLQVARGAGGHRLAGTTLATATLAGSLAELGEHGAALRALAEADLAAELPEAWTSNGVLYQRGLVRLAAGEPETALRDLLECGRRLRLRRVANPAVLPWRSRAAVALALLGRSEESVAMAAEEARLARRCGLVRTFGISLAVSGILREPVTGRGEINEAIDLLNRSDAYLDPEHRVIDLGRRLGRREVSPLQGPVPRLIRQLHGHGQHVLAARLTDLRADCPAPAGPRPAPRRTPPGGVLTAHERRLVAMAVEGSTNDQIAVRYGVSRRAIEFHFTQIYRKLGIGRRAQLHGALSGGPFAERRDAAGGAPPRLA
jgi:DNA-binding CsgD family transcriptional regulator